MPSSARRAMPQRRPTPIMALGVATVAVAMVDAGMAAIAKAASARADSATADTAPRAAIALRPPVRPKVGTVRAEIAGMANSVAAAVRAAGARVSGPTTKAGAPANQRPS